MSKDTSREEKIEIEKPQNFEPPIAWYCAKEIVPLIFELIQPKSVIDLGCNLGSWLAVFKEYGIDDILGIDGNHLIDRRKLQIPEDKFIISDLKEGFKTNKKYDLVICLELAQHIPKESSDNFIESITNLAPFVLFSAAIPFQGGGKSHVNEKWPGYWINFFQKRNYVVIDSLRKRIWENPRVKWWYSQNLLFFARKDYVEKSHLLKEAAKKTILNQISLVHPEMYLSKNNKKSKIKEILSRLIKF